MRYLITAIASLALAICTAIIAVYCLFTWQNFRTKYDEFIKAFYP